MYVVTVVLQQHMAGTYVRPALIHRKTLGSMTDSTPLTFQMKILWLPSPIY